MPQNQPIEVPVLCLDCRYVADDVSDGERHANALGHRITIGED